MEESSSERCRLRARSAWRWHADRDGDFPFCARSYWRPDNSRHLNDFARSGPTGLVQVGRLSIFENEDKFVTGAIQRAHAAVVFGPDTQIGEVEPSATGSHQDFAHVSPVHAALDAPPSSACLGPRKRFLRSKESGRVREGGVPQSRGGGGRARAKGWCLPRLAGQTPEYTENQLRSFSRVFTRLGHF